MSISTSSQALSNTQVSLETAFKAKSRSIQTRSLSSFAAALVITLTLALVFSIAYVGAPSTFTSSFSVFAAYVCSVLGWRALIDPTLVVRTSASAYTNTPLKSSFAKVKEHASKSCSLIVTSCFMTLSKTASGSVLSYIMSKYRFLGTLCLLRAAPRLSSTFTRTALFINS
jgi:hypothetical protein